MPAPQIDYSIFDRPEVLEILFYPRPDWAEPPPGVEAHLVPLAEGLSLSCRYYPASPSSPLILFFHGNGEVASDYDMIAPLYNGLGIGLFVGEYRGYGRSGGTPTLSSIIRDAHEVFRYVFQKLVAPPPGRRLFLMGRSLGSRPAVDLAAHYGDKVSGLIVESGSASVARLLRFLSPSTPMPNVEKLEKDNEALLQSIETPLLIIHGEQDMLIPVPSALYLHDKIGSKEKTLVIIPGAGHNDVLLLGMDEYLTSLRQFVFREAPET